MAVGAILALMAGPAQKLDLRLDGKLVELISDEGHTQGFSLRDGAELHLREDVPKHKSLIDDLKRSLDPYLDFDSGGVKLYEFEHRGSRGTFTIKPTLDKGPGVMLEFHLRF